MTRRTPGLLLALALGCAPTEKPSAVDTVGERTTCVGEGSRRHGPFDKPFEYMTRTVDDSLDPLLVAYAKDREGSELIQQTEYLYDADKQLVATRIDDDGDQAVEYEEAWTYAPDGQVLTWRRTDARGHLRASEIHFYARFGHLYRTLFDLDGDGTYDEIEEHDWDGDGRLMGVDRWNVESGRPLTRRIVEYTDPWPSMDRLERFDTDGDNVMDEGTWYTHAEDGTLANTRTEDGTLTTYAWDEHGNLVSSLTEGPVHSSTFEATYSPLGLPTWTRIDADEDGNGEIDYTVITEWSWTCDGPDADG